MDTPFNSTLFLSFLPYRVILLRKVTLVFVVVFIRGYGPGVTTSCCILVLLMALVAHSQNMPFIDYDIDLLEKLSIISSICLLCLGTMFSYAKTSAAIIVLLSFVVLLNLGFFLIAGYMYVITYLKQKKLDKLNKTKKKNLNKVTPVKTDKEMSVKSWGKNAESEK